MAFLVSFETSKSYCQGRQGNFSIEEPVPCQSCGVLMSKVDPSKRLTAEEALAHPWLATTPSETTVELDAEVLSGLKTFTRGNEVGGFRQKRSSQKCPLKNHVPTKRKKKVLIDPPKTRSSKKEAGEEGGAQGSGARGLRGAGRPLGRSVRSPGRERHRLHQGMVVVLPGWARRDVSLSPNGEAMGSPQNGRFV